MTKNAKETLKELLSLVHSKCNRSNWKFVLVSATLPKQIPEIGGISLSPNSIFISLSKGKSHAIEQQPHATTDKPMQEEPIKHTSNLKQWIATVQTKYRLAALLSLLSRWNGASDGKTPLIKPDEAKKRPSIQSILFVSTCDTVEFLYSLLTCLSDEDPTEKDKEAKFRKLSGKEKLPMTNQKLAFEDKDARDKNFTSTDISYNALLNTKIFKLHGSQTSSQRASVIESFRRFVSTSLENFLLITTSVGARGLDFPQLTLVLQWDAPLDLSEYKHKIGRTARWQASGDAVLFLMPNEDKPIRSALISSSNCLDETISPQNLQVDYSFDVSSEDDPKALSKKSACYRWISRIDTAIYQHHVTEKGNRNKSNGDNPHDHSVGQEATLLDKAKKAFIASLRAYATYPVSIRRTGVHPKNLHLGHYAKSFGLRETPGEIGSLSAIYSGHPSSQMTKTECITAERKAAFKVAAKRTPLSEFAA